MKRNQLLVLILFVFAGISQAYGSHIAGAELVYECLGNNNYRIRLKMYRDCTPGITTGFDDPLLLYIFESASGNVFEEREIDVPFNIPQVVPENWNACVGTPYNLCIESGEYVAVINLPALTGGYNIGWSRCCRNSAITNLAAPECEGITFLARVPGPQEATCNSMPVFNRNPSIFLCAGEPYFFDYSATDADGDSLVYTISNPFTGTNLAGLGTGNNNPGSSCGSSVPPSLSLGLGATPFNPMGPPPYRNVVFASGHSFLNPFGPGGYVNINPTTGYLEAFPSNLGVYVMAVSVKEYRNGVFLSENKRDFQFHVIACIPQGPPPVLTHNLAGLNLVNDTIYVEAGRPFCYEFTVTDPMQPSSIEVTPLSVSFGGNGGFPPPYATIQVNGTTPPVTGQICWKPACDYVGNLVPMIISARDVNDCPNYNMIFDTVWVRVLPPVIAPPVTQAATGSLPTNGDTIVLGVQNNFCFDFMVIDTLGGGDLVGQCFLQNQNGTLLNQVQTVTTTTVGDTVFGQVCWSTYCNYGFFYMFVIQGTDNYQCEPYNVTRDTIYLMVPLPYNPAPQTNIDLSPAPTNGDTVQAVVNEGFCFNFSVLDTSFTAGVDVNFDVSIYNQSGMQIVNNPVTYSVFAGSDSLNGIDSIAGQICWTPNCENVDELLMLVIRGDQENVCLLHGYDSDTFWIRVTAPVVALPLISHDLGPNFPGNQVINVHDDESFCFTFKLEDTVSPTNVIYSIQVYDAFGGLHTGQPPVLTFTSQYDSLLEGTICWTVPCELGNQTFKIKMTGRDSFDCRITEMVHDSVLITHLDNPPSALRFCNATVLDGDAGIEISWEANLESDVVGLVVYRKRDDDSAFAVMDTIFNLSDTVYIDGDTVILDVDGHSYCYRMRVVDRCANGSPLSDVICTVKLTAVADGYTSALNWTPFVGWNVMQYDIWRGAPIAGGFPSELYSTSDQDATAYVDAVVNEARLCYRIAAIADGGGCAERSWSNEACVNFPPTLYVPTGFTPNGDGLNDFFTSFGEFAETFRLEVFDRWGKLIFVSEDAAIGWPGSENGIAAPEGVYVFKVRVVGYNGEVLERNGNVTLIR
jgi:gliding motility-associated-like protein